MSEKPIVEKLNSFVSLMCTGRKIKDKPKDVSNCVHVGDITFDNDNINFSRIAKEHGFRTFDNYEFYDCTITGKDSFDFLNKDKPSYLTKVFFANTTFTNCKFTKAIIRNIRFVDCEFIDCTFEDVIFESDLFEHCFFEDCKFVSDSFCAVHFVYTEFKRATFYLSEFKKSVWFRNSTFSYSEMTTCTFGMYNAEYLPFEFTACSFHRLDVSKSTFENAKFDACIIDGITFKSSIVKECFFDKCMSENDHGTCSGITILEDTMFKKNNFTNGIVSISCCSDNAIECCRFYNVTILRTCACYMFDDCMFGNTLFNEAEIETLKDCSFYLGSKFIGGSIHRWIETNKLSYLPDIECDNISVLFIDPNFLFHNQLGMKVGDNSEIIKEQFNTPNFPNSFEYPLFYAYLNIDTERVFTFGETVVEFKLDEYFDALLNKAKEICTDYGYGLVYEVVDELKHQHYARKSYWRYNVEEAFNDYQEENSDQE